MICPNCGSESIKSIKFCTACGSALPQKEQSGPEKAPKMDNRMEGNGYLIGYSERINDPAFARYRRNSIQWSFIFAGILAVIVIVAFYIYGENSVEMDNPQALYIGMGIGGMFLTIALLQTIGRMRSKDWDGIVIDKKVEKKKRRRGSGDDHYIQRYTVYTVTLKTDQGKTLEQSVEDDDTYYNYFEIGDKVRHHKGLNTLEKYDKSKDSIIFCNACSSLNDINDEKCHRCSCPLLK